jgi:hypothetical protein
MAWDLSLGPDVSFQSHEDLNADQFRFVVLDATTKKVRRPDSGLEIALGVLQDHPAAANRAASVRCSGFSKIRAGAALPMGTEVTLEYVSATDAGKAIPVTGNYECALGLVVEPVDAEDELATIYLYGQNVRSKRKLASVQLAAFTANTTVRQGGLPVNRAIKITGLWLAAHTIPVDADGTCLVAVFNYDKSATTDDALLAASFNAETLVAKETTALTLTATGADLVLEAGDFVYVDLINNSAAIDTNWAGAALTIEYEDLA